MEFLTPHRDVGATFPWERLCFVCISKMHTQTHENLDKVHITGASFMLHSLPQLLVVMCQNRRNVLRKTEKKKRDQGIFSKNEFVRRREKNSTCSFDLKDTVWELWLRPPRSKRSQCDSFGDAYSTIFRIPGETRQYTRASHEPMNDLIVMASRPHSSTGPGEKQWL